MSLPPLLWNAAFPSFFTWLRVAGSLIVLLLASLLTGCGKQDAAPAVVTQAASPVASAPAAVASAPRAAGPKPFYAMMAERHPDIAQLNALGKALFFDPALSASGRQSCATCHSPEHAYGPPNNLSVQLGGADMTRTGVRAAPSLRYVQNVPAYTDHYRENDGNDAEDQGPTGGHNWDGRASSTHDQARIPLLSAHEMANGEPRVVVEKIRKGPYAETFRKVLGQDVLDDEDTAFSAVLMALEVFQQTPAEFYPYTSKYDAVLRGQEKLSPQELRGLRVFNDPNKGNCAACHPGDIREGAFPAFSDFGFIAVGVPRNRKLAGNADPAFFDMGLCGPDRTDLKDHADYCGLFRTPSLRNVALRHAFFHNGIFHSLDEVMHFYAERDVKPQKWYPRGADGKVRKFDDLPGQYHENINMEAPFGGKPGDKPLMTEGEMRDVIAFLKTLTDGHRAPAAPVKTAAVTR
ncbi:MULTISPECIES: cytochrome-c peroxidase [unclassified Cupriavidus]|uniref:cytochrome-c peroxidase n=1 Tax=unclassified Cupriavidus TaxID=2640874 RepID=UPI001C004772|nr:MULTISPECIES: cytochrome-c peroxidase [unclassified Cupriavidus]MCA3186589.1 cytochrome-c peroxidase [Cupriavidus sp.]MCA3190183.1 cytochrome-c peroxidase [Cupriavidus sp.]MCA3199666.1 cytochrome-c peroxidase [Cupriavidus sp.]MCA3205607.1 cytochrome-c peroxidase [Cupriavidus sp.]MCA3207118.1 cytochrome-c peroxidase [Cupriavidus sp.]